ncbi:MAG TPA: GNAT family N-acetyltransferase [Lapillicoccus sp.]|nr:GNAT family N-acetyltransferase [Lapillicoccus sp.]
MTESSIRVGRATDAARVVATDATVWFQEPSSAPLEEQLYGIADRDRYAAEIDGADPATYPGVYGVFRMTLRLPGPGSELRTLPCAGLSWVGVHPDHRRRGVLSAMMRHHLEQVHEEPGLFVSALHASEPAIYGRYGYGLASLELQVELSRGATLTAPGLVDDADSVRTVFASVADPDMPTRLLECHQRVASSGAVVGDLGYYQRICLDPPQQRRNKEPWRALFAQRDGMDVGFALFRRSHKWEKYRPSGELDVWGVVGDPAAQLALYRRLVDFDLMGTITVNKVSVDGPLILWAGGPRSTSDVGIYDSLWVRLVDLPEALQARTWSAPCDVVVDVEDRHAPWNQGTWRLHSDDHGDAVVERTEADADLRLAVQTLGGAYLGGGNLVAQHRAGLVEERRPGAIAELSRALRTQIEPSAAFAF